MAPDSVDRIFLAEPDAVALLAASDRDTWDALCLRIHHQGEACPAVLVQALLSIDDLAGWRERIFTAYFGRNPDDGMFADAVFVRWLSTGIAGAGSPRPR